LLKKDQEELLQILTGISFGKLKVLRTRNLTEQLLVRTQMLCVQNNMGSDILMVWLVIVNT